MSDAAATNTIAREPIETLLASLAAKVPTPGGGASAAITGATAAATAEMVVNFSIGKKSLVEYEQINRNAQLQLARAREMFLQFGDEDAAGYGQLNALWKLDKDDPRRTSGWNDAVKAAIAAPRAMLALSLELLRLCQRLNETTNRQLRSDLAIAAVLAQAAAKSAAWCVRINIPLLPEDQRDETENAVGALVGEAAELCKSVETGCA